MKKSILRLGSAACLLLLLLRPSLAFSGARRGLLLWSSTVLPTLLPFMICSNAVVASGALPLIMRPFRPVLRRFLHLSEDGGYVLVSGLLCGYPMGAKTCSEFLEQGRIGPRQARRLLAISNHPSPMFVLGFLYANLTPSFPIGRMLLILYLPVLILAPAARKIYGGEEKRGLPDNDSRLLAAQIQPRPESRRPRGSAASEEEAGFDRMMMSSIRIMVRIGGYIMLFSILAEWIRQIPFLPDRVSAVLLGLCEITTGIPEISRAFSGTCQGLVLAAVTAFGGLSGIFQTRSVIRTQKNAGLSVRHYVLWKAAHSAVTLILGIVLSSLRPYLPPVP